MVKADFTYNTTSTELLCVPFRKQFNLDLNEIRSEDKYELNSDRTRLLAV